MAGAVGTHVGNGAHYAIINRLDVVLGASAAPITEFDPRKYRLAGACVLICARDTYNTRRSILAELSSQKVEDNPQKRDLSFFLCRARPQ